MFHRIGALFYFLWGLLHLAAAYEAYRIALTTAPGLTQGRLEQGAAYVAVFAVTAILVAAFKNWFNSKSGYWINLAVVSAADIPFIFFVLLPGYMPLWPGALGPVLWIGGVAFTTVGRRGR